MPLRLWRETGATVLLITHALDEAAMLSDRVGVMSSSPGRFIDLVETGWPHSISIAALPATIRHMPSEVTDTGSQVSRSAAKWSSAIVNPTRTKQTTATK